jgi:hypothetical protein
MPEEMQRRFGYQSAVDEIFDFFHEFGATTVIPSSHTAIIFPFPCPALTALSSPRLLTFSVYYTMRRDEVLAMGNQVFLMGVAIRNDSVPDVYTMLRVDPSLAGISLNDRAMIGPTTTEVRVTHTFGMLFAEVKERQGLPLYPLFGRQHISFASRVVFLPPFRA